ncbi:sugar-binding protein [Singulisphaera sp. GP187]|uniref:sugar-binding protein n=1 Tax=Singulisphaera sp. GP187 TaxID=1882752 RepID=UPI0009415A90|nr:sugar-binding protein [Singulisphaera sp. GP187]
MMVLVALVAGGLVVYQRYIQKPDDRLTIVAAYGKPSPIADGVIGKNEYGAPVSISWTEDSMLAAFQEHLIDPTKSLIPGDSSTAPIVVDPTKSKTPADLSLVVYAAYSDKSLFLAFRVRDQFVDADENDRTNPEYNDGVEVFIDGDRVANDFISDPGNGTVRGSSEGFQLLVNAAGHRKTIASDFTDVDWKATAKKTDDGYLVEMEIPLALIDTKDGAAYAPAAAGSLLHFALAITDNDAEVSRQTSYAYLRTSAQTASPWIGREGAWSFAIKLEPRGLLPLW